jgi:two-component system, chemotaxis family, CheB/CheR fusion protein
LKRSPTKKKSTASKNDSPQKKILKHEIIPVVGIGASAGGFEAFKELLRYLPTDTGMAFVLVQHLDPKHQSSLAKLLAGATSMPLIEAKDGRRIERDCVYVMPENVNMTIDTGELHLTPRNSSPALHHPIDFFFESLAKSRHVHASGVVLSGTGSDGTMGLKAIKAEGGITFAQDEKSATFPEMPRSAVNAGAVDRILPLKQMAREIGLLAGRVRSNSKEQQQSETDGMYRQICTFVLEKTGFDCFRYKRSMIERRILRRMLLTRQPNLEKYLIYLKRNPQEVAALNEDLLIHVTNFFRDPEKYELLLSVVLPRMLKQMAPEEPIRIWVPGCSSGEEVYSIAILLLEFLDKKKMKRSIQIFGTDISERLTERARQATYPKSVEHHISKKRLVKFFNKVDNQYQVRKFVREFCVFAPHDLLSHPPFSHMNMISCCNLLIYFEPEVQNQVLSIFHHSLEPEGVLILGKSETTSGLPQMFEAIDKKSRIYTKKLQPSVRATFPNFVPHRSIPKMEKPKHSFDLDKAADKAALDRYSHVGLLVDEDLKIIQFRGPVARFLEPSSGQASLDLMKMIRQQLRSDLRFLILSARKKVIPVKRDRIPMGKDGATSYVNIEVVPIQDLSTSQNVFLILFNEAFPALHGSKKSDRKEDPSFTPDLQIELEQTKANMRTSLEELERLNEELQSANEELQSSNEELQSTNEEYETTKEELESSNEELMTLNEELQSRNAELDRMNLQLQASTDYAEAIIKTGRQPLVVLDTKFRIRTANPAFYKLLELEGKEIRDSLFFEVCEDFWDVLRLRKAIQSVLNKDTVFEDFEVEAEFSGKGNRTVILNGRRIQQKIGEEALILLAFEDITEQKASLVKDTMLREIHHRVKNNLQVITSLLNIQLNSMRDQEAIKAFQESQNRIQSMALIHEKLYQSNEGEKIAFKEYVTDLSEQLFQIYRTTGRNLTFSVEMEDIELSIANAVPCGLIINELLSNCLKYAFPNRKSGQIVIALRQLKKRGGKSSSKYLLSVQDDGVGIPRSIKPRTSSSLGMKIVNALTGQLKGEIRIVRRNGTNFQIIFPENIG